MKLWVTKQHRDLDDAIDVTRVPELKRIDETETHLVMGTGCTYQQLHAVVRDHWPDFGKLIRRIGGNVANGSPIDDTMLALEPGERRSPPSFRRSPICGRRLTID